MSNQTKFTDFDKEMMNLALSIAKEGEGHVSPNPMVGCVITNSGKVISRGYHEKFGENHAEVNAINATADKKLLQDSTLYVTLEPCCHHGKTPPCTELILKCGVKKIVIASRDPSDKVDGRGVSILKESGIEVMMGLFENEAEFLNPAFYKFHREGLPFVRMKNALSLNGKITNPDSKTKYLTGARGLEYVHQLRASSDAILVGVDTVISDNPNLGCRLNGARDPLRVILDSSLRSPVSSDVFRDTNCIIVAKAGVSESRIAEFTVAGIKVQTIPDVYNFNSVLKLLAELKITSVLVEPGARLASSLLKSGLYDEYILIYSPTFISDKGVSISGLDKSTTDLTLKSSFQLDDDLVVILSH